MTGQGYRNNSELTDNQLKMLKSLNRIDSMGIVPFDRNHERTLRSLARKGVRQAQSSQRALLHHRRRRRQTRLAP